MPVNVPLQHGGRLTHFRGAEEEAGRVGCYREINIYYELQIVLTNVVQVKLYISQAIYNRKGSVLVPNLNRAVAQRAGGPIPNTRADDGLQ